MADHEPGVYVGVNNAGSFGEVGVQHTFITIVHADQSQSTFETGLGRDGTLVTLSYGNNLDNAWGSMLVEPPANMSEAQFEDMIQRGFTDYVSLVSDGAPGFPQYGGPEINSNSWVAGLLEYAGVDLSTLPETFQNFAVPGFNVPMSDSYFNVEYFGPADPDVTKEPGYTP